MENGEYKRFLERQFAELKDEIKGIRAELKEDIKGMRDDTVNLKTDVATLKVKSGVWGAALFGAAMIAVLLFEFVFK